MGGQKEQMKPLRDHEIATLVPARLIENQENPLVWPGTLFLSEGCQSERKGRRINRRHEQPARLAALWLNKAVQVHPLIAMRTTARTRLPLRAQTRRRTGLRPMRCSSWLQSSTLASGYACCSFSTSSGSFFKSLLRGFVALLMLRARHARAPAKPPQVIPATTRIHIAPQALRHPGRDFGTVPQPSVSRRLIESLVEFLLLLQAEQRGRSFQALTLVTDRLLASLI